jgi:hypothetical protein
MYSDVEEERSGGGVFGNLVGDGLILLYVPHLYNSNERVCTVENRYEADGSESVPRGCASFFFFFASIPRT